MGHFKVKIVVEKSFISYTWFITGASGLVGSSIVELLRENDIQVMALVREDTSEKMINFLTNLDVKLIFGDLMDTSSYINYLPTCDVVVHAAATVRNPDKKLNFEINTEGTRKLCKSMTEVGMTRLIHISTAGIYGKAYNDPVPETTVPKPFGPYRQSKYEAEKLIIYEFPDLVPTIIRPPFVFGDIYRDRHLYNALIDNLPTKILPRVWRRNPKLGFVHAEDVARMVLQVGTMRRTPSIVYNIQSFFVTLEQLYEMIYAARGSEVRTFPIPFSFLYVGALVGEIFMKILGKNLPLRKKIAIGKKNWIFSTKLAKKELGFQPQHRNIKELEQQLTKYYETINKLEEDRNLNIQDYMNDKY